MGAERLSAGVPRAESWGSHHRSGLLGSDTDLGVRLCLGGCRSMRHGWDSHQGGISIRVGFPAGWDFHQGGISSSSGSPKPCREVAVLDASPPRAFWKVLGTAAAAGTGPLVPVQLSRASLNRKGDGSERWDRGQPAQPWAFFGTKPSHSCSPCPVQLPRLRKAEIHPGGWESIPSLCGEPRPHAWCVPSELGWLLAPWLAALPGHYIAGEGDRLR